MNDEQDRQTRCWAIIPAAGSSRRMGTELPKTYLPLLSSTVIETSIAGFLQHPQITGIYVAIRADDQNWQGLSIADHDKIETVIGGSSRALSVKNALNKLQEKSTPEDFVLVHDAARPCLCYSDLDLLINSLLQDEVGGILASRVHDTVKQSENEAGDLVVNKTLDRVHIWKAYTPQMFRISKLKQALDYCFVNKINVTDEASAMEALNFKVKLIEGRSDNIKITCKEDLKQASFILNSIHSEDNV